MLKFAATNWDRGEQRSHRKRIDNSVHYCTGLTQTDVGNQENNRANYFIKSSCSKEEALTSDLECSIRCLICLDTREN